MKLLLETAGTMEWEVVGIFDSYDEVNQWIEEEYGISYSEWQEEYNLGMEDWYDENELRVRKISER